MLIFFSLYHFSYVCLSVYLSVCLSVCLFVCLSICLLVCRHLRIKHFFYPKLLFKFIFSSACLHAIAVNFTPLDIMLQTFYERTHQKYPDLKRYRCTPPNGPTQYNTLTPPTRIYSNGQKKKVIKIFKQL